VDQEVLVLLLVLLELLLPMPVAAEAEFLLQEQAGVGVRVAAVLQARLLLTEMAEQELQTQVAEGVAHAV